MENQKEQTVNFGVGRFVMDIPTSLNYNGGSYQMRIRKLKEVLWEDEKSDEQALAQWEHHLDRINEIKAPEGRKESIIETKNIPGAGKWCKAVFYYGDPLIPTRGYLDVLVYTAHAGLWITSHGKISGKDFMYKKTVDIARAYRPPLRRFGKAQMMPGKDSFYMQYGAIDLPFEFKESVDLYFKGHPVDTSLSFSIETDVIDEVEKVGLMERLTAAIGSKLIPGVKIEKIRTGRRDVAGLEGEEVIIKGTEKEKTELNLQWKYAGEPQSGGHPEIILMMDTMDGKLEEKMALWDKMLDSLRPAVNGSRP